MIVPEPWITVEEVGSTQTEVGRMLLADEPVGVLLARNQVAGRGRFGRPWFSAEGRSLTMSIAFTPYVGHAKPWLLGMAVAIGVAEATQASLRWPNDLAREGRKIGGILTELLPNSSGRLVPVVGIGLNLAVGAYPEPLQGVAGTADLGPDPEAAARSIVLALQQLPEPASWEVLEPLWRQRDTTPGKPYKLPNGDIAEAITVGPGGELRCRVGEDVRTVLAADALFGAT